MLYRATSSLYTFDEDETGWAKTAVRVLPYLWVKQ